MKGRYISAILACDDNFGISKNGKIPWYVPEDLQHYKVLTSGNFVVVGRKTFLTLPSEAKKGRDYIILTSNAEKIKEIEGFPAAKDIYDVLRICDLQDKEKLRPLYVAGGAQTLHSFGGYINAYYITHIKGNFDCDVKIDLPDILKRSNSRYSIKIEDRYDIQMIEM